MDDDIIRQLQATRMLIHDGNDSIGQDGKALDAVLKDTLHYPTVPERRSYEVKMPPSKPLSANRQPPTPALTRATKVPEVPRKEQLSIETFPSSHDQKSLPDLPAKIPISGSSFPDSEPRPKAPKPQQNELQPSTFTFKPSAYLENGKPLRTIFLPPDLRLQFLSIASANTRANLETCGILCGTVISNALFVSKLVIPDQESTSDTCETINESELFDYCDAEDLMVLGWIHTHPTQTCFMSSRDLHTHCGYQVMMPESIAIVCAPSRGE